MSKKIVTNALQSPSLVGELKDYHKNLVNQIAKRGVLVLLSGIFLLLQYFVAMSPPSSANSSSYASDSIQGGISSKQEAIVQYDNKDSAFRSSLDALYITRDDLVGSYESTLDKWIAKNDTSIVAWSRSPIYSLELDASGQSASPSFLATSNNKSFRYYGRSANNDQLSKSPYKILAGKSLKSGNFAIIKDSGNLMTTKSSADTCYKQPNDTLSYINCNNSNTFKTVTKITNISYKTDAMYIKNRPGDRLHYGLQLENTGQTAVRLSPELYIGDILEYSSLHSVENAKYDKITNYLLWPQITLQPGQKGSYGFSVQLLSPTPLNARGATNTTSYDCYASSYFGGITNIKLACPAPKVFERMIATWPAGYVLALSWLVFVINIILYIRVYVFSKEHEQVLKGIRRKHV